ncbi:MAG: hypothetical protein U9P63_00960, partial [Patescibacteria group bacterium]|nr:hypothetical protein [Patescibacteria group bacterium]
DKEPKVTFHSIKIDDLTSETTYFYRTVSQSSPEKVSREHSFTTLAAGEKGAEEDEAGDSEKDDFSEESDYLPGGFADDTFAGLGDSAATGGLEEIDKKKADEERAREEVKEDEEEGISKDEDARSGFFGNGFLAGIAGLGSSWGGWLVILAIVLLFASVLFAIRKKRRGRK